MFVKKLEIEKTKTTLIISVLKVVYYVVLVFSISNFFISKNSQGRKLSATKKYLLAVIQLLAVVYRAIQSCQMNFTKVSKNISKVPKMYF